MCSAWHPIICLWLSKWIFWLGKCWHSNITWSGYQAKSFWSKSKLPPLYSVPFSKICGNSSRASFGADLTLGPWFNFSNFLVSQLQSQMQFSLNYHLLLQHGGKILCLSSQINWMPWVLLVKMTLGLPTVLYSHVKIFIHNILVEIWRHIY